MSPDKLSQDPIGILIEKRKVYERELALITDAGRQVEYRYRIQELNEEIARLEQAAAKKPSMPSIPVTSAKPMETDSDSKPMVVFVPGFFGTELSYRVPSTGLLEKVWSIDGTTLMRTLQEHPRRFECATKMELGQVLPAVKFGREHWFPLYQDLFDVIENLGYERGKDFQKFPYDWRLSIKANADELAAFVNKEAGGRAVKIIAHSMGGLIVRYMLGYLRHRGVTHNVKSVIQIATPVLGSSRAYHALKQSAELGDLCQWMKIRMDDLDQKQGNEKSSFTLLREAMNGFESVMELLPHNDDKILKTEDGESYPALHPDAWPDITAARLQSIHDMQSIVRADGLPSVSAIFSTDIDTDHIYSVDNKFSKVISSLSSKGDGVALRKSAKHGTLREHPIEDRVTHYFLPGHEEVLQIVKKEISGDNDSWSEGKAQNF